jgi:hypothetical protein
VGYARPDLALHQQFIEKGIAKPLILHAAGIVHAGAIILHFPAHVAEGPCGDGKMKDQPTDIQAKCTIMPCQRAPGDNGQRNFGPSLSKPMEELAATPLTATSKISWADWPLPNSPRMISADLCTLGYQPLFPFKSRPAP